MKKSPLIIAATLIAIVMISTHVQSQSISSEATPLGKAYLLEDSLSQFSIGLTLGFNRNYHSGGFRTIDDPGCPLFEDGTGWGFHVGLSAEFLPNAKSNWGIIPRITFEERPGQFLQRLPNAKVLLPNPVDPSQPEIVDQTVSTTSDITYSLLNAELLYKQEIFSLGDLHLGVLAGPAFQYVLGGTNRQVQDLEDPRNARFINPDSRPTENDGKRIIFYEGDIPDMSSTRFSVKAGIQGELKLLNNTWRLIPGIFYDYGLTNVALSQKEDWKVHTVSFQVDLRRAF